MLTVNIYVEVPEAEAPRSLDVARAAGFDGRLDTGWPPRGPGGVTLAFQIQYPAPDSSGPEQEHAKTALHDALTAAGIAFIHVGNGIGIGSPSSRFVIAPIGSEDPSRTLTVPAANRADFEQRLAMFFDGGNVEDIDAMGCEIRVHGLAANDPDVQELPFVPQR